MVPKHAKSTITGASKGANQVIDLEILRNKNKVTGAVKGCPLLNAMRLNSVRWAYIRNGEMSNDLY
jgi:hypothetical protein